MVYEYWLEIGLASEYFSSEEKAHLALVLNPHPLAVLKRGVVMKDEDGDYFANVSQFDSYSGKWVNEQHISK